MTEAESEELAVRRRKIFHSINTSVFRIDIHRCFDITDTSFVFIFIWLIDLGRAEGTQCTDETFAAWRDKFNDEMERERERLKAEAAADSKRKGSSKGATKEVDKSGRLTGFQHFTDKAGTLNLEAIEAAAENALVDENEPVDVLDENLFDVEDDDLDDLDDMDFDSDDDEPDIWCTS